MRNGGAVNLSRIGQIVSVVVVLISFTAVGGRGDTPLVAASTEPASVQWFETSPGLFRTNLVVSHMDFDPVSGLLYATSTVNGSQFLRAIDLDTFDVIAEVPIPVDSAVDLDVSRDGRTVFVATSRSVAAYSQSELSLLREVALDADVSRVFASPDDPERFGVTTGFFGLVVDGDRVINLADAVAAPGLDFFETPGAPIAWGEDSDTVYAGDSSLARLEVADPPVATAVFSGVLFTQLERERNVTFQDGFVVSQGVVMDPDTLEIVAEVDDPSGWNFPRKDGVGKFMMRNGETGIWALVESRDIVATRFWELPIPVALDGWVQLADERVAVLEATGAGSYLTVADSRRLASSYGEFTPVQPSRVLDTRTGLGRNNEARKLSAGETISVQVTGRAGVPAQGVLAVVMNATVSAPTQPSFFSIWPAGTDRPVVSNLNFGAGQQLANLVTAEVGDDGAVNLSNEFGEAHAILDVVGFYGDEDGAMGARYSNLESADRIVNTRPTDIPGVGALASGESRDFFVQLLAEQAARRSRSLVAVVLNVTAVRPTERGFFTFWPAGEPRPSASNLNFAAGDTRANLVVVGVGEDSGVSVYNSSGSADLLVDIVGVYEKSFRLRLDQQGKFLPIEPFRRFDSRVDSPFDAPGSLNENTSLIASNASGWTDIWNVTAVQPTSSGFLSVLGYDPESPNTTFPTTSNVNFRAGENVANAVYAPGAPDTEVYNPFGRTHLLIDVFGFLTPDMQRPIEEVWGPAS